MRRIRRNVAVCLLATASALSLAGCMKEEAAPLAAEEESAPGESSPEVSIEITELGFMDVLSAGSSPAPPEGATEEAPVAAVAMEAAAAEEGEGEEMEEEGEGPAAPRQGTVMIQYLVEYFGQGQAPEGVDVEWVQKDADGNEKKRYADWVVTDGLGPGDRQVDVTEFEVADYEDGDAFSVELHEFVPPEGRGD